MQLSKLALAGGLWGAVLGVPLVQSSHTVVIDVNDRAPTFFAPDVARVHVGDTVVFSLSHNQHNLDASPDGRFVYQTSWHGDQVGVYDRQEDRWAKVLNVGSAPAHANVLPDGQALVTINGESNIAVLDPR